MPLRSQPQFIMVRCRCKRILRTQWDQVGEQIQCWDCGAMVPVVVPRHQARHLGAMVRSVVDLFAGSGGHRVLVATIALTLALLIPKVGLILATVLLAAGGMIYGALIRADQPAGLEGDATALQGLRRSPRSRIALGWGLAVGTVVSLWVGGMSRSGPPHLTISSLSLFALTWSLGPMAAIALAAPGAEGGPAPSFAERSGPIRRHPLALLGALLIVPLGLIITEATLVGLFTLSRTLSLFVIDYMPISKRLFLYQGYVFDGAVNYHELPTARCLGDYAQGLRRGYCFVGTIPPSFTTSLHLGVETMNTVWTPALYFLCRVGATLVICLGFTLSTIIQARCLNALAHARQRRLA